MREMDWLIKDDLKVSSLGYYEDREPQALQWWLEVCLLKRYLSYVMFLNDSILFKTYTERKIAKSDNTYL